MTDEQRPDEPPEPEADDRPQSRPTIMMRPQVSEPRKPLYRVVEVVRTLGKYWLDIVELPANGHENS